MKMSKKNKKGVSLVYVIMASAVLMILSGALTASASHNIDLTARSTEGRQAYITAKSAMEYAKGVVNKQYESAQAKLTADSSLTADKLCNSLPDGFNDFSVKPDSAAASGLAQVTPVADPDGVNKYAKCAISLRYPSDLTKYTYDVQITVKVLYNSGFSKTLSYAGSYTLTNGASGSGKGAPFLAIGGRYGFKSMIVSNGATDEPSFNDGATKSGWDGKCTNGDSDYPLIFLDPVKAESGHMDTRHVKAPQIFFMATQFGKYSGAINNSWEKNDCSFYSEENDGNVTLYSDFIYINGKHVRGKSQHENHAHSAILRTYQGASQGVICFAQNFSVQESDENDGGDAVTIGGIVIPAGYYYFSDNTDLFSASTLSWIQSHPVPAAAVTTIKEKNNVDYITSRYESMLSANDSGYSRGACYWTNDGALQNRTPGDTNLNQSGKDVYLYVERNNNKNVGGGPVWNSWNPLPGSVTYKADYVGLLYVTNGDSAESCPFVVQNCTFEVKNAISLSGQKNDGKGDSSDKFVLKQSSSASVFNLKSSVAGTPVTVILQHDLVVEDSTGKVLYNKSAGNYTVPYDALTGTNIFSGDHFTPSSGSGGWDGGDMG